MNRVFLFLVIFVAPLMVYGQIDATDYFADFDVAKYDTLEQLGQFSLERKLGYSLGDYDRDLDRAVAQYNLEYGNDNIIYVVVGYSNKVSWKNGEVAGGPQDIDLNRRSASKVAFALRVFGCEVEVAGYRTLTDSIGVDVYVLNRPIPTVVPLPKVWVLQFKENFISVPLGATYELGNLVCAYWDNGVVESGNSDVVFSSITADSIGAVSSHGQFLAYNVGVAFVVAKYKLKEEITDTIKVLVFEPLIVPHPKWLAYGSTSSRSHLGIGLMIDFVSGWMINGDYSYANWNVNYEKEWNLKIGRKLSFVAKKYGGLYITTGIGRAQQLDNDWTATWGSLGLLYNCHLTSGIYFLAGIDAQYKFVHEQAKVGPLELWQDGNVLYYNQKIIKNERKINKPDGRVWVGFGIKL